MDLSCPTVSPMEPGKCSQCFQRTIFSEEHKSVWHSCLIQLALLSDKNWVIRISVSQHIYTGIDDITDFDFSMSSVWDRIFSSMWNFLIFVNWYFFNHFELLHFCVACILQTNLISNAVRFNLNFLAMAFE